MSDLRQRMEKTLEATNESLKSIRTGRANPDLLSKIQVNCYGTQVPLQQVATVSVPENMMLQLNVFDKTVLQDVEKAIQVSNLNLNPSTEGTVIRLRLPELTEERRQDLVKVAKKYVEEGKVSLRHIRRDYMDHLKNQEKNGEITEDEHKKSQEDTQKTIDQFTKDLEDLLKKKEQEILTV